MYHDIFLGIQQYSSHCYRSTESDYKSGALNDDEKIEKKSKTVFIVKNYSNWIKKNVQNIFLKIASAYLFNSKQLTNFFLWKDTLI